MQRPDPHFFDGSVMRPALNRRWEDLAAPNLAARGGFRDGQLAGQALSRAAQGNPTLVLARAPQHQIRSHARIPRRDAKRSEAALPTPMRRDAQRGRLESRIARAAIIRGPAPDRDRPGLGSGPRSANVNIVLAPRAAYATELLLARARRVVQRPCRNVIA